MKNIDGEAVEVRGDREGKGLWPMVRRHCGVQSRLCAAALRAENDPGFRNDRPGDRRAAIFVEPLDIIVASFNDFGRQPAP